jgi:hypothetical protein
MPRQSSKGTSSPPDRETPVRAPAPESLLTGQLYVAFDYFPDR